MQSNDNDNNFAEQIEAILNGANISTIIIFGASFVLLFGAFIYGSLTLNAFALALNAIAWLMKISTYLHCITMAQVEQVTHMKNK